MASYAAVLSLLHTLNHINIHPRPPILLDQNQVDYLNQNLNFFQDFLERYPSSDSQENDDLESRITSAAYAAEDVIETHIVDRIDRARSTSESISSVDLYEDLARVIHDMDLIKKEVMQIIQEKIMRPQDRPHLHTRSSVSTASTRRSSTTPVFDDAITNNVLDKLTGQQNGVQIIPIVGMGGIGKTTFAINIYKNPLIVQHFDTLAWVTISQEYSRGNTLQVLCREVKGSIDGLSEMSEDEMGLILYQHLWGRRYLIVMDDIWSIKAWDTIKFFFPEDNNGSRIMITTRMSNLALQLSGSHDFHMQFLDEDKSWDLLCEIVFGKLDCPIELEKIGNEIARKCRGLPLSIVVIGGILKNSDMTRAYWLYTLENLNLLINLDDDEYTLRILRTSYKELPMHLKPCFLYMAIFPENHQIKMSILIKLWVAEGILRPDDHKSLEEVAKDYLNDLIDRNLMLIIKLRWDGQAKLCKMHDLLRDVCLREAQKQKFFCIIKQQKRRIPRGIDMERRICIHPENKYVAYPPHFLYAVEFASLTRSLLYKMPDREEASPSVGLRLLRIYSPVDKYDSNATDSNNAIFKQANLRYISVSFYFRGEMIPKLLSSCSHFWNLQTLEVRKGKWYNPGLRIASAIWELPLLRHFVLYKLVLPDPPNGEHNFILKNLHTLSRVQDFKFSDEVIKRIPNVRKLKLLYVIGGLDEEDLPDFCLNKLGLLQKLESLNLEVDMSGFCDIENFSSSLVSFPQSLKKLSLYGTRLSWEELTASVGSLPLLQFLSLQWYACVGPKWETVDGDFCSLRVLKISYNDDLIYWETESSHFPRLEHFCLQNLKRLEIPSNIGDIPTLKTIRLKDCGRPVTDSAERIKVEQEENGNDDLQVDIRFYLNNKDDED